MPWYEMPRVEVFGPHDTRLTYSPARARKKMLEYRSHYKVSVICPGRSYCLTGKEVRWLLLLDEGVNGRMSKNGWLMTRGLLVYVTIHSWKGTKTDKELSKKAAADTGGEEGRYKTTKQLARPEELKAWNDCVKKVENLLEIYCPKADHIAKGARFIRSPRFLDFKGFLNPVLAEADQAKIDFKRLYPGILADGKNRLGTGFDPKDYPKVEDIDSHFGIEVSFRPLPMADLPKFEDLPEEEQERVRTSVEEATLKFITSSRQQAKDKMREAVSRVVERVGALVAKHKGEGKTRFYSSVIDDLKVLVRSIPDFNIGDDTEIEGMIREVEEKLLAYTPEQLKGDPQAAEEVLSAASDIQQRMSDWGG